MSNAQTRLQELLSGAQLPALPQSAIRLLQLSKDPEAGPAEYAVPVEADPGLTGQVLKFVNSSYFGFSREISSIKLAITLVGVRTIKNFTLWSAVFSLIPNPKCGPFDLRSLWQDSLRRGLFARAMGKQLGIRESEDLFAGALLQDMAVPMLAKELPDDYAELLNNRDAGRRRLSELEMERFGWTHAQAAGVMARSWGLPESFATLIETHADLEELMGDVENNRAAIAVSLSALLPAGHDSSWSERNDFRAAYEGLRTDKFSALVDLLKQVDAEYAEFAPLLKLATNVKPLAQSLAEADTVVL
ncbi:HDOD domain-containing protein [Lignipirellula cremea]|uniref:HDOD domain protein n=1 Tax=Lignipirellula cremea TaxID=2528010 RepID=A0A518DXX9_9BACT|nr:HDOD domain-containing protein [Lignipirellula cremea]QDU96703.1 HDOD domain protein [Lignipirellula cremea]